jgi:PaREP15, putative coiled-coil protein
VADVSGVAYDALKTAVEHVLGKIKEGKKLSTEDILILYLGAIVGDLKEIRADMARLDNRIDETNKRIDDVVKSLSARIDETNRRIDETNKRIDELARSLSARIDETNKRIDDLARRVDDLAKRIDAVQAALLEIQKLLLELVKTRQSTP